MWNSTRSVRQSWAPECGKDGYIEPPSGPISKPSTAWHGVEAWISSLPASLASLTPPPEGAREPTTSATYGQTYSQPSARWDRATCTWRTLQGWLIPPKDEPPTQPLSSESWPRWGTTVDGALWPLETPVLRTAAIDGSAWPTATVSDQWTESLDRSGMTNGMHNVGLGSMTRRWEQTMWPTPNAHTFGEGESTEVSEARREQEKAKGRNGNGFGLPLAMASQMWPNWATPQQRDGDQRGIQPLSKRLEGGHAFTLPEQTKEWATPTTQDAKNTHGEHQFQRNSTPLSHQAPAILSDGEPSSPSGQTLRRRLNPRFVEWLMGLPVGWTDIEGDDSLRWGTA
jgi:hypothetical protein